MKSESERSEVFVIAALMNDCEVSDGDFLVLPGKENPTRPKNPSIHSHHRHKPHPQLRLSQKPIMQQIRLQIERLSRHPHHVKRPQYLGDEQLPLHPCHFPSDARPWAKAEGVEGFEMIVCESRVVQGIVGGKPSLGAVA